LSQKLLSQFKEVEVMVKEVVVVEFKDLVVRLSTLDKEAQPQEKVEDNKDQEIDF
jgi:hypothetical protein